MGALRSNLKMAPSPYSVCSITVENAPEAVHEWLTSLNWRDLELLARCTAKEVGSGTEMAHTLYDDDGEGADEPFVGVKIIAHYIDVESTVFSRHEYDQIVADVCDIAIANPPDPLPEWWERFLANAAIIRARAEG